MSSVFQQISTLIQARTTSILVILAVLLLYSLLPLAQTATQEQDRIIKKRYSYPNEPLRITTVRNQRGIIELGKKFSDSDDWYKELTVSVENISGKEITYISIGLTLVRPENQAKELPLGHSIMYGNRVAALKRSAKPIEFKYASIDIKLSEQNYDSIKTMLKNVGYPSSINAIEINIEDVIFGDGTAWATGTWFDRDPNDPDKLIPRQDAQGSV